MFSQTITGRNIVIRYLLLRRSQCTSLYAFKRWRSGFCNCWLLLTFLRDRDFPRVCLEMSVRFVPLIDTIYSISCLQAVRCWWATLRTEKVDPLFRGCDGNNLLCCHEWIWPSATRGWDDGMWLFLTGQIWMTLQLLSWLDFGFGSPKRDQGWL